MKRSSRAQGVAVGAVAAAGRGQRAGRVGGDELDLDLLGRVGLVAAVLVAGRQHVRGGGRVPGVGEEDVQEAGSGHLDALDLLAEPLRQRRAEPLGDLTRRRLQRRRQQHRRVRREVAEPRLARALQRRRGRAVAEVGGGGLHGGPEFFDRRHSLSDGRARPPGSCGRGTAARAAPRGRAGAEGSSGPARGGGRPRSNSVPYAPPSTKHTSRPAWRRSSIQRAKASESYAAPRSSSSDTYARSGTAARAPRRRPPRPGRRAPGWPAGGGSARRRRHRAASPCRRPAPCSAPARY